MARKKTKKGKAPGAPPKRPPAVSWWDRLPGATQHGLCLALLLLVTVGFFAPALFSGKSLVGSDTVNWRATAEALITYREATGQEALWDTNVFAGMPGYLISFPKKIPQIDLLPDSLRAFAWPVSHFLFLLLGAYLLVFFLTKDRLSGVLVACAYGLTTYLPILLVTGHNTKFVALCYAPWLVLAFVYALRRPGLLTGLLFAVALAVHLRAGHVQITYYVAFLLGLWWIVEGVGAVRQREAKGFGAATLWLALGAALALLMVAQPYLSTFEYKDYTIRGATTGGGEGGLDWSYAMAWSQGLGELVTLLVADAFGGGGATYWGPKTFTAGPHYVGGIVLLLAALALWRYRRGAVWALGLGTLLMTAFALGENFPLLNRLMFNVFPLFDAFRVPETWLSVVALALALLAGLGLFYVARREPSREDEARKTTSVYVAAGAALGLVVVLLLGKGLFFDFERPDEYQLLVQQIVSGNPGVSPDDPRVAEAAQRFLDETTAERAKKFTADAVRTLLFLLLAAGALAAYRKEKLPGWAMQAALAVLVVIDLGGVGRRYLNEDALQPARDAERLIARYGFDDFILQRRDEAGGMGRFRVLSLEANPSTNARPSFFHESIGGYHGAKLRLFQDYLDHLLVDRATGRLSENGLDLLNTRYVVARSPLPGTRLVYQDQQTGLSVFENPDAVPRAFFVGQTEVVATPEETWARLQDETFDPNQVALLPEPIDFATTPLDSSSTAAVTLQRYGPREIAWQVETDAPRLLVVSEIYYPAGWQAFVDGEAAPIYRADYLLRAVPVPAGAHEVVMRFEPTSYRTGLWVAGVSTALVYGAIVALLATAWLRRRKTEATA